MRKDKYVQTIKSCAYALIFAMSFFWLTSPIVAYAKYDTYALNDRNKGESIIKTTIVIDPGHQSSGNSELEPVSPGSSKMKAKVSSGTRGVKTGVPEYMLTLDIAVLLKDELESRGYTVILTRDSNDVNISNSERAMVANENHADAYIRIHANGSENAKANGAMTICQTQNNPNNGFIYKESKALSEAVLDHYVTETGFRREHVWETDTMTGLNWAAVPSTIIEMGYMTNPEEDEKMQDPLYQGKMVEGIADGIDAYFGRTE